MHCSRLAQLRPSDQTLCGKCPFSMVEAEPRAPEEPPPAIHYHHELPEVPQELLGEAREHVGRARGPDHERDPRGRGCGSLSHVWLVFRTERKTPDLCVTDRGGNHRATLALSGATHLRGRQVAPSLTHARPRRYRTRPGPLLPERAGFLLSPALSV